jgi:acetate kinase
MNTMVFRPQRRSLHFAYYPTDQPETQRCGQIPWEPGEPLTADALRTIACGRSTSDGTVQLPAPDIIAVHCPFGGESFSEPAIVDELTDARLTALAPNAPIHVPRVQALLRASREAFAAVPKVLVFETAFFARLPERESGYGLEPDVARQLGLRRYGYHGILHEAACWYASHHLRGASDAHEEALHAQASHRILSVCLDDRPEIAAVLDSRPVMVTGGATPLEGLPGRTLCGEIDPGIVLSLASEHHWGPEQINTTLTERSGLLGLAGMATDLDAVFATNNARLRLARLVVRHRILLACGAGIAALGGLDAVVFSGNSRRASVRIARWLRRHLATRLYGAPPRFLFYRGSLDRAAAELATTCIAGRIESGTPGQRVA